MQYDIRNIHRRHRAPASLRRHVRARHAFTALATGVLVATGLVPMEASATHYQASLEGSRFQIDADANLTVDPSTEANEDWANAAPQQRKTDAPTGKDDDSYGGGAKEDDPCPSTTTGKIPDNKSDLLTFGAYHEEEDGGPGFLHLFWSRVNEPSGTTVMDFELNQSTERCINGVNNVRTAGDLLIEYLIEQGGSAATVTARTWTGTTWGPAENVTDVALATGTINSSPIPAAQSDGLITSGSLSPRTFGEMSLDLDFVFDDTSCQSFASAFLKSRASTAFNSQLKDFIRPVDGIEISNCGKVIVRKQTDPDEDPNATQFDFAKEFPTEGGSDDTFSLTDDGVRTFDKVLAGDGYTVTETVPSGWVLKGIDCGDSTGTTPVVSGSTVTFDLDPGDVVDCTFTNARQRGAIQVTKTRKHAADGSGDHPHAGVRFTVDGMTKATGADGVVCFDGLELGTTYTVHEVTPEGYATQPDQTVTVDNDAKCSDTPFAGEEVSFSNTPLTDITVSVDSQVDGGTASTISCVAAGVVIGQAQTGTGGDGSLSLSDLEPGTYTCTVVVDP